MQKMIIKCWSLVLFCFNVICGVQSMNKNFTCYSGQQVPIEYFCDGTVDCEDNSDEIATSEGCRNCNENEIRCNPVDNIGEESCVLDIKYVCDDSIVCKGISPCDAGCDTHYRCRGSDQCVARATICDGNSCYGCPEDKEWGEAGIGFKCLRNGKACLLPQQLVRDQFKDCDNGEDLCYKVTAGKMVFDESRCFKCFADDVIIPRERICDAVIDCPDMSDECLCQKGVPVICEHVVMLDVAETTENETSTSRCDIGEVQCGEHCIRRSSVCDGITDCSDAIDERFAYCRGSLSCDRATTSNVMEECRCNVPCFTKIATLCDGIGECPPDGLPADECNHVCIGNTKEEYQCVYKAPDFGSFNVPKIEYLECKYKVSTVPEVSDSILTKLVWNEEWCDGKVDCPMSGEDEDKRRCPHRFYCATAWTGPINIPAEKLCDGEVDCDDGSDELNNTLCLNRFFCPVLGKTKISIDESLVCDFNVNCDDSSDEIGCEDGRFYCEDHGETLFVKADKKFDGRGDCADWSDECPTISKEENDNVFSSRYELIANPVLRALVWVMGLFAIAGNMGVLFDESRTLLRIFQKTDSSASLQANHMLVFNLAFADLLMGIYLLLLGSAGVAYSGVYCANKLSWLSSSRCTFMGCLVVISTQTSVVTMILLTSFRLYAVFHPFTSSSKPKPRLVIILIICAWLLSIVLAVIPITEFFESLFVERAWIPDNPFFQTTVVDFRSAKSFVSKLPTFVSNSTAPSSGLMKSIDRARSWTQLRDVMSFNRNFSKYLEPKSHFGYYSSESVCIPKIFVATEDRAWAFSFVITLFNFMAFAFVACSYFVVYVKSRRTSASLGNATKSQKKSRVLQRKILRLVATDFCCWVPISFMAFINIGGVKIPGVAYAVAAIVLLPINSALNPILYSNFVDQFVAKAWHSRRKSTTSMQTQVVVFSTKSSAKSRT